MVDIQKCFLDKGFDIQENKADILEAAEIDLAMYGELIAVVASCAVGACEPTAFFTNYASRTKEVMGHQITTLLTDWVNIFGAIESSTTDIGNSVKVLIQRLETLPEKIEEIRNKTCQNDACLGPAIGNFTEKISNAVVSAKTIEEVKDSLSDLDRDIPKATKEINKVIDAASNVIDVTDLAELASNFSKIEDLVGAIQIAKELPKLGRELHNDFETVTKFITTFGARSNQAMQLFTDLLDSSWESFPLEFTTDSSGAARTGIAEIQKLVRNEISEPLQNVTDAFQAVQDVLTNLPFKNGPFDVEVRVASYQRWSDFSLKMPCLTTGYQTFDLGGVRRKFPYPKFYACDYKGEIKWPNHHIPYIKIKMT
ncbi:hypothetical protein E8E12_001988 [Didymella heteroderae]|uniref:Uncharacterized protein n=1 Tax=Didymella heteroderae TaxID=1769908 RepID=A0A9P4WGH3_9PLEO|nr:hypothetical protein E8E12_001988 [Didymella heteroderae]